MSNETREFGLFLDGLRVERNMSRDDLIDDIMSLSQYKRYLRGDTSIPNAKLVMLADRLRFSINDIYTMFRRRHSDEYNKILEIYSLIKSNSFQEAYDKGMKMSKDIIVSDYNKLFYDFCMIKIQHRLRMVSDVHVLDMYSKLIDYPNCVENESLNMVEIITLNNIVDISSSIGNFEPSNFLYSVLNENRYHFSTSDHTFMPTIYASLASTLGKQDEYKKVVEVTEMGIEYCIKYETSNSLSHLFFYNSMGYFFLDDVEKATASVKKCIMNLIIENQPEKLSSFKSSIEKTFEKPIEKIIGFSI